ncbi:hypothetical protein J6590_085623 [Homalodisca vitripennis]|nr:hypothetical protein J6590_085623 [Homalodisca vitripennis]
MSELTVILMKQHVSVLHVECCFTQSVASRRALLHAERCFTQSVASRNTQIWANCANQCYIPQNYLREVWNNLFGDQSNMQNKHV